MSVFKSDPLPMFHTKKSINQVLEPVLRAQRKLDANVEEVPLFCATAPKGDWTRDENAISNDEHGDTSEKVVEELREEGSSMMEQVENSVVKEPKKVEKKESVNKIVLNLKGWKEKHQRRIITLLDNLMSGDVWETTVITEFDTFGPTLFENKLAENEEEDSETTSDEESTDDECPTLVVEKGTTLCSAGSAQTSSDPTPTRELNKGKGKNQENTKDSLKKTQDKDSMFLNDEKREELLKKELFKTWLGVNENGKTVYFLESMLRKIYKPVPLVIYNRSIESVVLWLAESSKYADQLKNVKLNSIRPLQK